MLKTAKRKAHNAFFSIDAGFALVLAVLAFASFSMLLSAASAFADSSATETSSSLVSLRFSSYILSQAAKNNKGIGTAEYTKAWEIDKTQLEQIDLQNALAIAGKEFASVSVKSKEKDIFFSSKGQKANQVYCTKRLALMSGEPVLLEVCMS